ncbi:MAG: hypothetical protein EOP81_08420 [Variovorax sp.]|nr:MAG: hypothetical protein EOP81_08420 [Variovorax sp.]
MSLMRFSRSLAAATVGGAALLAGALTPAQAAQAVTNPPIRMAETGIEYMCGGKGQAEMAFMQTVAPRWAATLEFAVSNGRRGEFTERAQVQVRDKYNGHLVMKALSQGPFMLTRLEPGAYDVDVTLGGLTLTQSITVIAGVPARALFVWPSNFDMASARAESAQTVARRD